jgi:hypothetical protein
MLLRHGILRERMSAANCKGVKKMSVDPHGGSPMALTFWRSGYFAGLAFCQHAWLRS